MQRCWAPDSADEPADDPDPVGSEEDDQCQCGRDVQHAKARQKDPAWQQAYRAYRPVVERKISRSATGSGAGESPLPRSARILTDIVTRAGAINLARLATLGLHPAAEAGPSPNPTTSTSCPRVNVQMPAALKYACRQHPTHQSPEISGVLKPARLRGRGVCAADGARRAAVAAGPPDRGGLAAELAGPGFVRLDPRAGRRHRSIVVVRAFAPSSAPGEDSARWSRRSSRLAAAAALVQPRAGRARDDGSIGDRTGLTSGLVLDRCRLYSGADTGHRWPRHRSRVDRDRGWADHPDRIRLPGCRRPERTTRTNHGLRRSRPRTRRRRRPPPCRRPRRRHHPHPRAAGLRRTPHRHRRPPRRTQPPDTGSILRGSSHLIAAHCHLGTELPERGGIVLLNGCRWSRGRRGRGRWTASGRRG